MKFLFGVIVIAVSIAFTLSEAERKYFKKKLLVAFLNYSKIDHDFNLFFYIFYQPIGMV